jgi:molecular chaperone HscA
VKPSYGLSNDQVAQMIQSSMLYAKQDMQLRLLREQQVEANRVYEAVSAAISADAHLLSASEIHQIELALHQLKELAAGDDTTAIKAAIEHTNHLTDDFAARRMDMSIRLALQGHKVDEV